MNVRIKPSQFTVKATKRSADTEWLALDAALQRLRAQFDAFANTAGPVDDKESYEEFCVIRDRVVALPATTAIGRRVKAQLYLYHLGESDLERSGPAELLAYSLARDMVAQSFQNYAELP